MKTVAALFVLLVGFTAQAGLFGSDEPPKELLSANVSTMLGVNNLQSLGYTVQQFTDAYKQDKTSWEKDGGGWIFHIVRSDKMTNQKTNIAVQFQTVDGNRAVVPKWVVDQDYLPANVIHGMLMRMHDDMVAAGMIKIDQKARKPSGK